MRINDSVLSRSGHRRPIHRFGVLAQGALAALLGATAAPLCAQTYPDRPIRMIVPFPPGGGADALARITGQKLSEAFGQQVIVDNRAGAGGNIAAEVAARSPADGYTLYQANVANAISMSLHRKLGYDLARDFIAVTQLASIPFMMVVTTSLPANSIRELIALAKSRSGQINYGSSGSGGPSHLAMEMFRSQAGIEVAHVPYKGAALATTDLLSGQIQIMFMTLAAATPLVTSGRLRALGVGTLKRVQMLPDLPTIAESGMPGFEASSWFGLAVPAGTPAAIVNRLNREFVAILNLPEVNERLSAQGFDVVGSSQKAFADYIRSEIPKWARVVKASGARAD